MGRCTIPLWLVFTLQSLVVMVSFIAVILVLSLQQQDQFKSSVFREIDLQLRLTNAALTAPILERERGHTQIARRTELDKSLWYQVGDSIFSDNMQRFLNLSYFMMYEDPLAYSVYQHRLHPTKRMPAGSVNGQLMYGVVGLTREFSLGVSNFNGTLTVAPNPTFPLQYAATISVPYEVSTVSWSKSVRNVLKPIWLGVGIFHNPITQVTQMVCGLAHPLEINTTLGVASLSIAYAIDVRYLIELSKQAILTPTTKALLVHRYDDNIIASVNANAAEFNPVIQAAWFLYEFPDQDLVAQYNRTEAICSYTRNCTMYAKEDGASILSLLFMTTRYGYKMSFFQITPRAFYFAAGKQSAMIGIVIGVVAAVVVLVSCVVIWFAVRGPVRRLRESMELAAVMRNEEVSDTSSVLTELDLLSQSFTQMNDKLLQARAFMPQSMLYGGESIDVVEEDDDEGFVMIDVRSASSSKHPCSTPTPSTKSEFKPSLLTVGGGQLDRGVSRSTSSKRVHTDAHAAHATRQCSWAVPCPEGTALVQRKVGVLIINARGTHTLATSGGAAKLEREQVRLVELVERCARAEKGVVDAFQGDHFVLTFNAVRAVGSPGQKAALVGLSVEEGAQRDGLALGRFSMGLSVGRAHVGNVGSATMKKNCTVGGVYTNAAGLERLAKRVGRTCVVNGRSISEIEVIAYCLALGSVQMQDGQTDDLWAVMNKVDGGDAEEWLYEMEEAAKGNPYRVYNDAVHGILKGEDVSCFADVTAYLPQHVATELSNLRAAVEQEGVACLKHQCI